MDNFDKLLEEYLENGINYEANTVKNADRGDLEQLAADSYFYGWNAALDTAPISNQKIVLSAPNVIDDDSLSTIKKLINEYKKEELPHANESYHCEAEIAAGFEFFIEWLKR